jgi:hypothetical protein
LFPAGSDPEGGNKCNWGQCVFALSYRKERAWKGSQDPMAEITKHHFYLSMNFSNYKYI